MTEIAVVLILALVFLGPKKLPELASGLGKMIREIKKVTAGVKEEIQLDDNVRKPFEELREALTLPAEELKRRDEWKAEWEKRQQEEAAQAQSHETSDDVAHDDGHAHGDESPADLHGDAAGAPAAGETEAPSKSTEPAAFAPTTFAGGPVSRESHDDTVATAPVQDADKTVIGPPPSAAEPFAPRLPTAPPPGAVPAGGRTMMGVAPAGTAAPSRPTPPPPPPAAARLPVPKVLARDVPRPQAPGVPATATKPESSDAPAPPKLNEPT